MKIIKPLRLSILNRAYKWQKENYLGISVLALADMGDAPRLRPEQELWQLAESELTTSGGIFDLAMPKACAEFLATGYAYTHHQKEKNACAVKIQIEQKSKTLLVFGDRHWVNNHPSQPLPFDKMRLDWSRAFGGQDYRDNPYGLGSGAETIDGIKIHRLPNIESLHHQLVAPEQKIAPAGFGPLDFTWPARFSRIGKKYDEHWLQHEFPGLSRDADWHVFNSAAQDQWWEKRDALPPCAPWRIWNMHPEKALQEGHLPPWQARCFINRQRAGGEVLEEVALRATTVWFFPHREQMVLIWHGSTRINEDDAADVLQLMPALEHTGSHRSVNHYRKVLQQRCDKQRGALFAFREKDLLPEDAIGPWLDTDSPVNDSPMRENLQNRERALREKYRARMEESGVDINNAIPFVGLTATPPLAELPAFVDELEAQAEKMRLDAYAAIQARGISPDNTDVPDDAPRGPESMHKMLEMLHASAHGLSKERLDQTTQALHHSYRLSVQAQKPAQRLTGDLAQIIRNRAITAMENGKDFSGLDFTGADLSGLDLRGANFSGALLESADLSRCRLDGANFTDAVLARADLSDASLRDATLDGASLSLARCCRSDFTCCRLKDVQLQKTLFEGCIFDRSQWADLLLNKTYLSQCRFHHAQIENVVFLELDIAAPDFSAAQMVKGTFIRCNLAQAVFDRAVLNTCSWVETNAEQIRFRHATLSSCAFAADTRLCHADFSHSTLIQSNLRQMPLQRASFHMAKLESADLSEADCQHADMRKMNAAGSLFIRTDLRGARLEDSNLIGALMQKCLLSGADLRTANLFRADLSQSSIDATTRLDGAYTRRTKTLPRRSPEPV